MRRRGPAGEGRSRKRKIFPLMAGLMAAAIAAAAMWTPGMTAKAAPIDLGKMCSLTVDPSANQEIMDDLQGKEVVIDLYKVADAVEVSGYDTYGYQLAEPFGANEVLKNYLTQEALSSENMSNDVWQNMLAQEAAKLAIGDGSAVEPTATVNAGVKSGELTAGLYLLVVEGEVGELEPAKTGDAQQEGQEAAKLVTTIRTGRYEYTFAPQLISLPSKDPVDGVVSTANPGDWKYDMEAALKPERKERKGSLEIVKTLQEQAMGDEPATFVFRVDAYLDKDGDGTAENVYNNVVSITFTEAGEKSVTLAEEIPLGARVVVEEVYSGASYTIVGEVTQEKMMTWSADDPALQFAFTNTNDDHHRGGHGIMNSFRYDGENGSWEWTADPEQPGAETE